MNGCELVLRSETMFGYKIKHSSSPYVLTGTKKYTKPLGSCRSDLFQKQALCLATEM